MVEARLLDLERVTALRSQTIFHAVAECADDDTPTLCVLSPDRPYVSIGYHQDAAREIDLEFCRANGIPVFRRQVGGGAVLLDAEQLFFHLILPRRSLERLELPLRLDHRYRRLATPAIAAYRRLGLEAEVREPNDLFVRGRKIGGTGAATIGDAFVFVGSLLRRFDHTLMARVLRLDDEDLRERLRLAMVEGVTTLERELGVPPSRIAMHDALLAGFRDELGLELTPGSLTAAEEARARRFDRLFASEAWLCGISSRGRERKIAVNATLRFRESERGWVEESNG